MIIPTYETAPFQNPAHFRIHGFWILAGHSNSIKSNTYGKFQNPADSALDSADSGTPPVSMRVYSPFQNPSLHLPLKGERVIPRLRGYHSLRSGVKTGDRMGVQ